MPIFRAAAPAAPAADPADLWAGNARL